MKDLIGKAVYDEFTGVRTAPVMAETTISEADEFPVSYMFRDYDEMPAIEQKALDLCRGNVFDVGCGAGSHALWLQDQGLHVTAIDISPSAVRVANERGVLKTVVGDFMHCKSDRYDTILMLMNGTGLFGALNNVRSALQHLASLLNPGGQILIDSSDIIYMYDEDDDGGKWVPADRYYGELEFTVHYEGESESFPWLYIDYPRLKELAGEIGLDCEMVYEGDHYDYLARITKKVDR
ncbi:class I SAM-dependent methyltransferase [Robertkochia sediminum]|uniref:class I SAM-dependent methyltransferase n=1 Tax=Robertkochia sediminum TaxID=2785326 RepID=UPI00193196BF|nr:class I SAM-dependent methyltransferase [Robertkochia sediminum]MBL7471498.1 class I SAM-dependent methyltransferase [Robertkochia sediminum]